MLNHFPLKFLIKGTLHFLTAKSYNIKKVFSGGIPEMQEAFLEKSNDVVRDKR